MSFPLLVCGAFMKLVSGFCTMFSTSQIWKKIWLVMVQHVIRHIDHVAREILGCMGSLSVFMLGKFAF